MAARRKPNKGHKVELPPEELRKLRALTTRPGTDDAWAASVVATLAGDPGVLSLERRHVAWASRVLRDKAERGARGVNSATAARAAPTVRLRPAIEAAFGAGASCGQVARRFKGQTSESTIRRLYRAWKARQP